MALDVDIKKSVSENVLSRARGYALLGFCCILDNLLGLQCPDRVIFERVASKPNARMGGQS